MFLFLFTHKESQSTHEAGNLTIRTIFNLSLKMIFRWRWNHTRKFTHLLSSMTSWFHENYKDGSDATNKFQDHDTFITHNIRGPDAIIKTAMTQRAQDHDRPLLPVLGSLYLSTKESRYGAIDMGGVWTERSLDILRPRLILTFMIPPIIWYLLNVVFHAYRYRIHVFCVPPYNKPIW